jgi:hypothetical protein
MKWFIINSASLALGLGAWVAVGVERRQIFALRSSSEARPGGAAETAANNAPSGAVGSESSAQSEEIVRLRAKASQLLQQLRSLQSSSTGSGAAGAAVPQHRLTAADLPDGYRLSTFAEFRGAGSPEAAFESMQWAARSDNDINTLLSLVTGSLAKGLRDEYERQGWDGVRNNWLAAGFRIVSQEPGPDDSVRLKVEIVPGAPPEPLRAVKGSDGSWRIDYDN